MEVVSKPTTGEGAPGSGDGPGGVMASPSLTRLTRGSASPQRVSAQRDVYVSQARRALAHAFPPTSAPLQPATPCTPACNSVPPACNRVQPARSPSSLQPHACSPATVCTPSATACSPPTAHTRAGLAPAPLPCSRARTPAAHAELDDAAHQDALRLRRHAGGQAADDQPAAQPHARLRRGRHARAPPDALLGQQPRAAAGRRGAEPLGGGGQRARRAQALAQPLAGPDLQRWRVRQQAQSTPSAPPWHAAELGCLASPGACLLARGGSAPLAIPPLPPVPEPAASSAADSAVASCPCRRSMRRRLESLGGAAPERSDSQASGEASDMGDNSS